ncbi:MAG: PepSY domain-containing protein, partial [Candidatus Accumulibacter sp.]|nr:PepSY domain-containing protein [Accumulibacter sp.]
DRQSVVELRQNMAGGSIADGRGSLAQSLRFDGVSGQPLEVAAAPPPPSAVQTISNVFIMLHRGLFASPVPRWLLFLAGIGGCLMIASGLVMWSIARDKAREKLGHIPFGQQLVEVFNVSGIAGLLVAIGAYFWANRLIPADLPQRNAWEIRVFFIVWAATLAHALLRKNKTAWVEELVGAGLLIAALPLLNALTGGLSLIGSIARGQGLLAGFDLCALAIGMGLFYAARQVYRHTPATRTANTAAARSADTAGETAAPDGETSPAPQPLSGFAKPQAEESR